FCFFIFTFFFQKPTQQYYKNFDSITPPFFHHDSLEFDEKSLKPTYRFLQGVPGNSYAFELATNLGLPKHIIERARSYITSSENEIEQQLKVVYQLKLQAERLKTELEAEKAKYQKLREEYEALLSDIKAKRKQLLDNAKIEAYEIIRKANALVENTIKEVREQQKSISEIKKDFLAKKKEIEDEAKNIFHALEQYRSKDSDELSEGDFVYLDDPTNTGQVLRIYEDSGEALIDFNGIKFKTKLSKLRKSHQSTPFLKKELSSDYIKFSSSTRLDLRGFRVDEAIREVDKFISEAILGNIDQITIVHGKGTGTLRQSLHEYFKNHPQVENFREGTLEEGGAGVTIVKLR
ncbi:MAG: Smr/MutS family protein, partial [Candidatus Kapaibacteriota bacterium]